MRLLFYDASRPARGRFAAASVEMAVLAPILITMMLGMFELSRAMMVKQTLTGAARKGCRTGIIHQYGNSDITTDAKNIMQDNGFDTTRFNPPTIGSITIVVTDPNGKTITDALDAPSGSTVSVKVSIPVSSFAWLAPKFMSATSLESDQIVMMKQ